MAEAILITNSASSLYQTGEHKAKQICEASSANSQQITVVFLTNFLFIYTIKTVMALTNFV